MRLLIGTLCKRLQSDDYLFVAAIDIGTTYSGYAFSSRDNYKENPTEIITKTWNASSGNLESLKTSTCVLFDEEKKFHSFGFAAEDKFMQLASENKHKEWFFVHRFKMELYNKKTLDENLFIKSENGESLPALTVFSAVISYLKNKMMEDMMLKNLNVHDYGLRWVITVPAIWTDSSKSFMRRCAIEAGIAKERLTIALEPEAAAIYTNFSSIRRTFASSSISCRKGIKYLVCDAGGGTVDITVHEMIDDEGHVRELYKASGGDWGGTKVDQEVKKFYEKIVGKDVMEKFKERNMEGALELARDFETKKRAFKPNSEKKVLLKFPLSLQDIYEDLNNGNTIENDILKKNVNNDVQIRRDKIVVSADVFGSFFTPSLVSICNHISKIFENPDVRDVKIILLVGGYAESEILTSELEKKFPDQKLVIPKEPGLSVLKGAVIFGHEPELIQERKAKYTYGIECSTVFCEGKHREDYKKEVDGVVYCARVFDRHVKIGSSLTVGKYQSTRTYSKQANALAQNMYVYASSQENPKYVTDDGCFLLGSTKLEFEGGKTMGASVIEAQMSFSGTEIEVTLTCKTTGRVTKVHLENK
ncbi:heat shock 70 kDa protein 12A-like [Saccostrea cucullata]|uniref:heat shock 70 kDa protein 12A-like n=1 Tax=Saccostrea cuccullata TaxID=36930 RepID=UPI002ED66698